MSAPSAVETDSPSQLARILLLLLCGLPAAGKSSLAACIAREAAQQLANDGAARVESHLISFDRLYHALQQRCRQMAREQAGSNATSHGAERADEARRFNPRMWRTSRQLASQLAESIVQRVKQAENELASASSSPAAPATTKPLHLLLLDDNFHLRSMRHQFYQLARQQRVAFLQLHAHCDVDEAVRRNEVRRQQAREQPDGGGSLPLACLSPDDEQLLQPLLDQHAASLLSASSAASSDDEDAHLLAEEDVSEQTIRKMALVFEPPPSTAEQQRTSAGWERHSVQIDTTHLSRDQLPGAIPWSRIASAFYDALPPPPLDPAEEARRLAEARAHTMASLQHALDLHSRRVLSERIAELQASDGASTVKSVAHRWNALRRQLLSDAKRPDNAVFALLHSAADRHASSLSPEEDADDSESSGRENADHPAQLEEVLRRFRQSLQLQS